MLHEVLRLERVDGRAAVPGAQREQPAVRRGRERAPEEVAAGQRHPPGPQPPPVLPARAPPPVHGRLHAARQRLPLRARTPPLRLPPGPILHGAVRRYGTSGGADRPPEGPRGKKGRASQELLCHWYVKMQRKLGGQG